MCKSQSVIARVDVIKTAKNARRSAVYCDVNHAEGCQAQGTGLDKKFWHRNVYKNKG